MDLAKAKKHAKAKIVAGQMVQLVRDALIEEKHQRQDVREKTKEALAPVIEELEELKEEVTTAAAPAPPAQPLPSSSQAAALPAPPILVVDPNHGFSKEDLEILKQFQLPTPQEVFQAGNEQEMRIKAGKINKSLGGKRTKKTLSSDEKATLDNKMDLNRRYQERLRGIELGRSTVTQRGKGVLFYNNPEDLWQRLHLLGGSIRAGNNSRAVAKQFSAAAHKLRDLGQINGGQLNDLLREYYI